MPSFTENINTKDFLDMDDHGVESTSSYKSTCYDLTDVEIATYVKYYGSEKGYVRVTYRINTNKLAKIYWDREPDLEDKCVTELVVNGFAVSVEGPTGNLCSQLYAGKGFELYYKYDDHYWESLGEITHRSATFKLTFSKLPNSIYLEVRGDGYRLSDMMSGFVVGLRSASYTYDKNISWTCKLYCDETEITSQKVIEDALPTPHNIYSDTRPWTCPKIYDRLECTPPEGKTIYDRGGTFEFPTYRNYILRGYADPVGVYSFGSVKLTTKDPVYTIKYTPKDCEEVEWTSGSNIENPKGKSPIEFTFNSSWLGCKSGSCQIHYETNGVSGELTDPTQKISITPTAIEQDLIVETWHTPAGKTKTVYGKIIIKIDSSKGWLQGTVSFNIDGIVDKKLPIDSDKSVLIDKSALKGLDTNGCNLIFTVRNNSTTTPSKVSIDKVEKTIPVNSSLTWEIKYTDVAIKCLTVNTLLSVSLKLSQYGNEIVATPDKIEFLTTDMVNAIFTIDRTDGVAKETEYTITSNNSSYKGYPLTYTWKFYNGLTELYKDIDYKFTEGDEHSKLPKFILNVVGTITVKLIASYSGVDDGVATKTISSITIYRVNYPANERFVIGFWYKDGDVYYTGLASRLNDVRFSDLKFNSAINKIGNCTFKLYFTEKIHNVIRTNAHIIIFDNIMPVWTGVITELNRVNINTYNKYVPYTVYEIKCEESIKELSFENIPSDMVGVRTGTIQWLVSGDDTHRGILPKEVVGDLSLITTVEYSISLDTTSVLTALNSLSNQLGWRYRIRPDMLDGGICNFTIENNELIIKTQFSSRKIKHDIHKGNFILLHFVGNHWLFCYVNKEVEDYGTYDAIVRSTVYYKNFADGVRPPIENITGIMVVSNRNYIIDYMISYYQQYVPISYQINDKIHDVSDMESTKIKFGEISVYGIGYSGETISSTMTNWTVNEPNYTIMKSNRIAMSYDSSIDTVIKGKERENEEDGTTSYIFTINLNGWAFPENNIPDHKPHIFYKDGDLIKDLQLTVTAIKRTVDHSNHKKTSIIVETKDENESKIIESLVPLTNVIFDVCFIISGDGQYTTLQNLPADGKHLYIGDSEVRLVSRTESHNIVRIVYSWYNEDGTLIENRIPHGHHTDVLVLDASGSLFDGHDKSNPVTGSPRKLYPNTSMTLQGPEGYSAMEMERLSCRYMQYGTNYSVEGKAKTNLLFFRRTDFYTSTERILYVGDRVEIQKKTSTGYDKESYELQGYEVNADTFEVNMSFGMPFVEIGNIIYNMNSNATMSIVPTDSHTISGFD